jgi:hypothetical protein
VGSTLTGQQFMLPVAVDTGMHLTGSQSLAQLCACVLCQRTARLCVSQRTYDPTPSHTLSASPLPHQRPQLPPPPSQAPFTTIPLHPGRCCTPAPTPPPLPTLFELTPHPPPPALPPALPPFSPWQVLYPGTYAFNPCRILPFHPTHFPDPSNPHTPFTPTAPPPPTNQVLYPGTYAPNLDGCHVEMNCLGSLLAAKQPRLASHLAACGCEPSLLTTDWYLCLYATSLPPETAARVWDSLWCEGRKVLHRMGLALLSSVGPQLMKLDNPGGCGVCVCVRVWEGGAVCVLEGGCI